MSVTRLLAETTSAELSEWAAFFDVEASERELQEMKARVQNTLGKG